MVKYYYYNEGKITEQDEFRNGSVVVISAPSQNEIIDVAGLLNIVEDDIKALVMGDFDKIERENILAAKFNSSLNVMIESGLNYMIICHDNIGTDGFDKECAELIHSLWGGILVSKFISIEMSDIRMIFEGATAACTNSSCVTRNSENKTDAGVIALSAELLNVINKSNKVLCVISASRSIDINDIDDIVNKMRQKIPDESTLIFAVACNDEMNDEIHVTIISPVL